MRDIIFAVVLSLGVLFGCLAFGRLILDTQPVQHLIAHHAYEPFTIELSVKDR